MCIQQSARSLAPTQTFLLGFKLLVYKVNSQLMFSTSVHDKIDLISTQRSNFAYDLNTVEKIYALSLLHVVKLNHSQDTLRFMYKYCQSVIPTTISIHSDLLYARQICSNSHRFIFDHLFIVY